MHLNLTASKNKPQDQLEDQHEEMLRTGVLYGDAGQSFISLCAPRQRKYCKQMRSLTSFSLARKKVVQKVTFREETPLSHCIHTMLILESSNAW